jgi:hypothetical protein
MIIAKAITGRGWDKANSQFNTYPINNNCTTIRKLATTND